MPSPRASAGTRPPSRAGVATHCAYCGLQCAMTLTGTSAADLTVSPRRFPTNRGGLCQKGWTSAELLRTPSRLTTPLVRRDGELVPASWDEALDVVADGIVRTQTAYGRDAVAVFGGGGLTNEKAYQLGKFARVALRTSQIDYNGRWCMSSAAAAGIRCFGLDRGLPFPVTDIGSAHAVLLLGANPAETMPPFLTHLVRAADAGGLMVADPRLTPTAAKAIDGGGLHLQLRPGTDAALALGMLHLAVTEGYADRASSTSAPRASTTSGRSRRSGCPSGSSASPVSPSRRCAPPSQPSPGPATPSGAPTSCRPAAPSSTRAAPTR